MPNKCVVGGCSNAPDLPSGIGLHTIPFFGDERHEAKKRRKKWVDFVKAKRAKWEPTKNSVVCTKHFRVQILDDSECSPLLLLHQDLVRLNQTLTPRHILPAPCSNNIR